MFFDTVHVYYSCCQTFNLNTIIVNFDYFNKSKIDSCIILWRNKKKKKQFFRQVSQNKTDIIFGKHSLEV